MAESFPQNTTTQSTISTTTPSAPIHPALTISIITNIIKITFSIEKSQYNTWSELFKIHVKGSSGLWFHHSSLTTNKPTTPSLKETVTNIFCVLMLSYYIGYMTPSQVIFSMPSSCSIQPQNSHGKSCLTFSMTTKTTRLSRVLMSHVAIPREFQSWNHHIVYLVSQQNPINSQTHFPINNNYSSCHRLSQLFNMLSPLFSPSLCQTISFLS